MLAAHPGHDAGVVGGITHFASQLHAGRLWSAAIHMDQRDSRWALTSRRRYCRWRGVRPHQLCGTLHLCGVTSATALIYRFIASGIAGADDCLLIALWIYSMGFAEVRFRSAVERTAGASFEFEA
jgi:hypothetical protein